MSLLEIAMYAALLLVCGAALLRGRRPERLVAGVMLVTFAVNFTPAWHALLAGKPPVFYSPETTLVIDILQLTALLAVALGHRPAWTLFAAAFQLLAMLISFVRLTDRGLSALAYLTAQNALWWLTMATLAFGVWQAMSGRGLAAPGPSRLGAGAPRTRA